ncbi:MAG TPA: SH3 domain-containing protein, partial [Cytophagales bacterium]|nr:SH3 domain-containing protein [Cytophagales bacterium]
YAGPGKSYGIHAKLKKNTYVEVIGRNLDWYVIELPDRTRGYLHHTAVGPAIQGSNFTIAKEQMLYSEYHSNSTPITKVASGTQAQILAVFSNAKYIRINPLEGWVTDK